MSSAPHSGRVIAGRYELQQELGRGGMGVVYKAFDRVLDEAVAIKLLLRELALDGDAARRFRTEIKLARRVSHPNVCRIHDYGDDSGLLYISMELVAGCDLKQLLRRGTLAPAEAFEIALQVAAGLRAIHSVGIVHRDLKTPNLMRDHEGRVRIMDFGIARRSAPHPGTATAAGMAVGTPDYMSPEQALGRRVDARSDLYAFGVVVFELFTGQLPFHGDTPMAVLLKHINEPPPLDDSAHRRLPPALVPVLRRALAKDVGGRYATAEEMARALERARDEDAAAAAGVTRLLDDVTPEPAVTTPLNSTPLATGGAIPPTRRRWAPRRAAAVAAATVALLALLALATLRDQERAPKDAAAKGRTATSAMTRPPDGAGTTPTAPSLVTPAASAPRRERPAPIQPSGTSEALLQQPSVATAATEDVAVPIGTRLFVTVETVLRSDHAQVGDEFSGSLADALTWDDHVVAPAGTPVRGRVVAVGGRGAAFLELALNAISLDGTFVPVRTGAFRLSAPAGPGGASAIAVIVGAASGAALGAAARGREGAVVGAAAGAALAGSVGSRSPDRSVFTYSDRLPFRLAEPLSVPPRLSQGRSS